MAMAGIAMALEVNASDVAPYQKYEPDRFAPGGGSTPTPDPVPTPNNKPAVDPSKPVVPVNPVDPAKPSDPNKIDSGGNININPDDKNDKN